MKTEKSIFEKKYIAEAQARKAADKAGIAEIKKVGSVWMMVEPKAETPAPAATPAEKPRVRVQAGHAVPTPQAEPVKAGKSTKATKAAPEPETVKREGGRPLSPEAAKARRRLVNQLEKQMNAGQAIVTVKEVTKATKLRKVTVSNQIRWAEAEGLIKREGYKLKPEGTPGRKEVMYTLVPAKVAAAAQAA